MPGPALPSGASPHPCLSNGLLLASLGAPSHLPRSCQEGLLPRMTGRVVARPRIIVGPLRRAGLLERLDLFGRIARLGEHLHGVLAERGGGTIDPGRGPRQLDREAELCHLAELRLLVGDGHLALPDELGLQCLVELEDRLDHRVVLVVERLPFLPRLRPEDLGDFSVRLRPGLLELLLDQLLATDASAERRPELRLERAAAHPAVLGLVRPVADDPAGEHHLAAGEVAGRLHHQPGERAVRHRDVDDLPLAAPPRLLERRQDPHGGHQAAASQVRDLGPGLDRGAARLARQGEETVQAQVVHVVARAVAVRAVLAVAGDRAVDERRVRLAKYLVADAQVVEHTRPEALDQGVGGLDQLEQRLSAALLLQVDPDRALVAVERQVERRAGPERGVLLGSVVRRRPADVVALAGVLDLDHVGAEIGEQQGAEPAGQKAGEIEDLDVGKGPLAHDQSPGCSDISRVALTRALASSPPALISTSTGQFTVLATKQSPWARWWSWSTTSRPGSSLNVTLGLSTTRANRVPSIVPSASSS